RSHRSPETAIDSFERCTPRTKLFLRQRIQWFVDSSKYVVKVAARGFSVQQPGEDFSLPFCFVHLVHCGIAIGRIPTRAEFAQSQKGAVVKLDGSRCTFGVIDGDLLCFRNKIKW